MSAVSLAWASRDLVERGQTAPLLVLLVQRRERGGRAGVVGSHGEDALVGPERPVRRVEALGVHGGAAEAQVDLEVGVGRLVGGAREDLDEALPVAVLRVELGEPVVVADGDVAVAQDAQRLRVTGLQSKDAAPRAHRLGGIAETIGVDAPELQEDREARGPVGRELGAALEHVGDRREVLVALGLLLERVERGGRRGLLVEHALVQGHRLGAEVEALGRELGHLHPQFPALRPFGGRLGLLGEEIEERPVGAPLGVELLESIDRFPIPGLDCVQLLVRLDGVLHVGELIEPPPRDDAPQLRLHPRLDLEVRLARLHRQEVAPALERVVDPRELPHAHEVGRVELHDLREHGDERRVALHLVAVDEGNVAQDRQAARRVVRRQPVELLTQQVRQRVPARRLAIEALERVARFLVAGVLPQDRAPLLDRLLGVRAVFCQLGHLGGQRASLRTVGRGPLRVAEDRRQATVLAARRAPLAEKREHPRVGGIELAESLEPPLRGLRPPAHAPVHHGDLERRAGLLLLAPERAGRELTLVERDEVLPHLVGREMIGEEAGGLRVARRDVEDALVGGGGAVGRLELLRERPREPQPAGDLLVLLGRFAGEALAAPRRRRPSGRRREGDARGASPRAGSSDRGAARRGAATRCDRRAPWTRGPSCRPPPRCARNGRRPPRRSRGASCGRRSRRRPGPRARSARAARATSRAWRSSARGRRPRRCPSSRPRAAARRPPSPPRRP